GEHRRHGREDMPNGEIGRHLEGALSAHAGFDDVACIHGSWIRLKFVLTQAPMSSSFRGARSASPESILPVAVWIPGLRQAAHPGMTSEVIFSAPLPAPRKSCHPSFCGPAALR